ncbi:MAG: hypothetical protein ACYSUR_14865 [Planctomycetota bacterium]
MRRTLAPESRAWNHRLRYWPIQQRTTSTTIPTMMMPPMTNGFMVCTPLQQVAGAACG